MGESGVKVKAVGMLETEVDYAERHQPDLQYALNE
jgi:hypothetical protein